MLKYSLFLGLVVGAYADIRRPAEQKSNCYAVVIEEPGKPPRRITKCAPPERHADIRPPVNLNPATATWIDAVAGFFLACAAFFTGRRFWKKK